MLSRVADSIYWMARYIERAENVARFVGVNLSLVLDTPLVLEEQWEPLLHATDDFKDFEKIQNLRQKQNPAATLSDHRSAVLDFLTFDLENHNSVASCIAKARENARLVRGYISTEMWEQINKLYHFINDPATKTVVLTNPIEFFIQLKLSIYTLNGITEATFSRDDGWGFQQMGTYLERADKTNRILDVKYYMLLPKVGHVGSVVDDILWAALLQSVGGFQTFKQKYHQISPEKVVEFLLLDRQFPRSVFFCLQRAMESLFLTSGTQAGSFSNRAEQKIARLFHELQYTRVEEIIIQGLHEYLQKMQENLYDIGQEIFSHYFKYPENDFLYLSSQ